MKRSCIVMDAIKAQIQSKLLQKWKTFESLNNRPKFRVALTLFLAWAGRHLCCMHSDYKC